MLVLTRRIGEAILIEHGIEIIVLAMKGGQVRIGVSAPSSIAVLRSELAPGGRVRRLAASDGNAPSLSGRERM